MEVPLKSQPQVSTVSLLDDTSFASEETSSGVKSEPLAIKPTSSTNTTNSTTTTSSRRHPRPIATASTTAVDIEKPASLDSVGSKNYKLTRTYSETETNNFDDETGHRLFDDGFFRPKASRTSSPTRQYSSLPRLYSRSHRDHTCERVVGLEDEYVPGLDFSHVVYEWNGKSNDSGTTTSSHTPASRNGSYLDLDQLHAKVAPQPIKHRQNPIGSHAAAHKYKLSDFVKLRYSVAESNPASTETPHKRQKSTPIDSQFEAILQSLPQNFSELPYSQRKKLVQSLSDSVDYSQFSVFAKNYFAGKSNDSPSGSLRKSSGSLSTIAGRLLAISSSSEIKSLPNKVKENVDEKGAMVLGHKLGQIIGFGAWGIIRECTAPDNTIKAVKIVKSYRDGNIHNPKVLQVFRKEIEIWKQLHHKNILPLIDHVEANGAIFCITNRIFGGTLFEVVTEWGLFNQGTLNGSSAFEFLVEQQKSRLEKTANYAAQITDSLRYLHEELGIVHGDLKLENVLVNDVDKNNVQMILCDFGMSRKYTNRLSRQSSRILYDKEDRSKSSHADLRRPYNGGDSYRTRYLFKDDSKIGLHDSKIGISDYLKPHGPSMQSVELTPTLSRSLVDFHESKTKDKYVSEGIDSNLPHSHIGSLPYASPELLLPSPPPLGPSADIWALGVLMYTMVVGKLPFQHPYEPRLRAIISAGKYSIDDLNKACFSEWLVNVEKDDFLSEETRDKINQIRQEFAKYENHYQWLENTIIGCLDVNITKRFDLDMITSNLSG